MVLVSSKYQKMIYVFLFEAHHVETISDGNRRGVAIFIPYFTAASFPREELLFYFNLAIDSFYSVIIVMKLTLAIAYQRQAR